MSRVENLFTKCNSCCLIVVEISANHGQDFNRAVDMIKAAKECGADAVKFQAYTPDAMTINADNKYFRIKHPQWGGQTLYELYKKVWSNIRSEKQKSISQPKGWSYHRMSDRAAFEYLLTKGWDTPVAGLVGKAKRENTDAL